MKLSSVLSVLKRPSKTKNATNIQSANISGDGNTVSQVQNINGIDQLVGPVLVWQDEEKSPENLMGYERLMYTSGIDEFFGREAEFDLLRRFTEVPSSGGQPFNFRWMLLTGEAGVGKTRLAYEFTRKKLDNDLWHKGKLNIDNLKAFDNPSIWRPDKSTFIVIDYVQSVPKEVHKLLAEFSSNAAEYKFPVRLLLLERSANPSWTDKLLPVSSDKLIIKKHQYLGQSVLDEDVLHDDGVLYQEIKPLSDIATVDLMKCRIHNAQLDEPVPDSSSLLSLARSVDYRETLVNVEGQTELVQTPRPFFAIATAEAIIDGMRERKELPKYFERTKVLADIVQRDRGLIWNNNTKDESQRRLYEMGFAVATLSQGVSLHDLNNDFFGDGADWLPPTPPGHDSVSLEAFGCRGIWWPPMEPDILGEYFVSEKLLDKSLPKELRTALIEGALLLREEQAVITFFRMALDFPDRFEKLQMKDIARDTVHEKVLLRLTSLSGNLIGHGFDFDIALGIFDAVLGREDWKKSPGLGFLVASAAFIISTVAGRARNWDRVSEMLDRLDALRMAFPQNQEIAPEYAKAASNISYYAGAVGEWDRVTEMLARLDALRTAFPKNQAIALFDARTALNISSYDRTVGDRDRVTEILARLDALRSDFPKNQEIALKEANAVLNISNTAGTVGKWVWVTEMLDRLDALRTDFPKNQEIALVEAKAACNITNGAGTAGDWDRVTKMLDRLDALRTDFPKNQEIALAEAYAVLNNTNSVGTLGDWVRVTESLARLDALRTDFPKNQEIALVDAKAAFNIAKAAGAEDDWDRVTEMLARLDALRTDFPKNQEIALVDAKAAFDIAGAAEDGDRVTEMLARLDALRADFPDNQEIALAEATAAYNISTGAGVASDWDRVTEMLARFGALRTDFPKNQEIALVDAKASFNIANAAGEADDGDRVTEMLARLDVLRTDFPKNREIALVEADAATNISRYAGTVCDQDRVTEVLSRFDALRLDFPDNQEIALVDAKAAVNISNYAGAVCDRDRITAMLARLDALRTDFPDNQEIALVAATAAANISAYIGTVCDQDRVIKTLSRLDALRTDFPDNQEIALVAANAAFNIFTDARRVTDRDRVTEMLARLDALRTAFPKNQEIALVVAKAHS